MTTASDPAQRTRGTRARRLLAGGAAVIGAGALVALPFSALAQDDDDDWLSETLQGLVDDGTITSEQADAVEGALEDARPAGPFGDGEHRAWGGHGHGPGPDVGWGGGPRVGFVLDEAAAALGIDVDALFDALRDGQTIADVAEDQGVDVQAVIDALVLGAKERMDEAVADGRIEAADAQERLDEITERITELVEEGFPARSEGPWDRADEDREPSDGTDATTPTSEPAPSTTGD